MDSSNKNLFQKGERKQSQLHSAFLAYGIELGWSFPFYCAFSESYNFLVAFSLLGNGGDQKVLLSFVVSNSCDKHVQENGTSKLCLKVSAPLIILVLSQQI